MTYAVADSLPIVEESLAERKISEAVASFIHARLREPSFARAVLLSR